MRKLNFKILLVIFLLIPFNLKATEISDEQIWENFITKFTDNYNSSELEKK